MSLVRRHLWGDMSILGGDCTCLIGRRLDIKMSAGIGNFTSITAVSGGDNLTHSVKTRVYSCAQFVSHTLGRSTVL